MAQTPPAGTYSVDPAHTNVEFVARHMMVTKVRGSFPEVNGTVVVAEDPTQSSVEASVTTPSVTTGDAQRDGHLRGADFFDVDNYKAITFKSTKLEPAGDNWKLTGDLTIKDVTKPVTFDLEYTGTGTNPYGVEVIGFEAQTTVNRHHWNLNWNVALEAGGVLVGDKVQLTLDVQAHKQS